MLRKLESILMVLTLLLLAGCLGFYLGRSSVDAVKLSGGDRTLAETSGAVRTVRAESDEVPAATAASAVSYPLDLNGASREQLQKLPGVGEVLAQRILEYREENGGFSAVEELLNVEGIGEKTYQKLLDYLTVEH